MVEGHQRLDSPRLEVGDLVPVAGDDGLIEAPRFWLDAGPFQADARDGETELLHERVVLAPP